MPNMTLAQFAQHFTAMANTAPRRERGALAGAGARLARWSRSYIGTYQDRVGPFPAWKPLSVNTLTGGVSPTGYRYKGKFELGYNEDPLLRTGNLRGSIQSMVIGRSAIIGSDDPVARWQEFGTQGSAKHIPIPPRSFIGRAMAEYGRDEVHAVARVVFRPLLTGRL